MRKGWRTFPSPPCGRGLGWGVRTPCLHYTYTPYPSPPPQGGREFCPLALRRPGVASGETLGKTGENRRLSSG